MSYHGYLPTAKAFLNIMNRPVFLEIGVDTGASFLTLTTFLTRTKQDFVAVGVDIKVQDAVSIMLANLDRTEHQQATLVEENSLTFLPKLAESGFKCDLVMLDGDHNYHTVLNELRLLKPLLRDHTIIICDDYDGRWSDKDLWYAERPGYENVSHASKKVDTEKHGVKAAVDEWVAENPEWSIVKSMQGEPVVLIRTEHLQNANALFQKHWR